MQEWSHLQNIPLTFCSLHQSIGIMRSNSDSHAFVAEAYFTNGSSVITTQWAFRNHFNVTSLGPVPKQMGHYGQNNCLRPPRHMRTLRDSTYQCSPALFCAPSCAWPRLFWTVIDAHSSLWSPLSSLRVGNCAGTFRTWFQFLDDTRLFLKTFLRMQLFYNLRHIIHSQQWNGLRGHLVSKRQSNS